jgi:phage portal protein BeeE
MRFLPSRRKAEIELVRGQNDPALSLDGYIGMLNEFFYGGSGYSTFGGSYYQTAPGQKQEPIGPDFRTVSELAYKSNGIVFACMATRAMHFSEARFAYRRFQNGRPQAIFTDQSLSLLETPWPGGTTRDLLSQMLMDADLAGNAFVAKVGSDRLARLRPDWVTIAVGVPGDSSADAWDSQAEVVGYFYKPGGYGSDYEVELFSPEQVAHFKPHQDPEARFRGMSPLQPIIREIMADKAATTHKLSFLERGATPNLMVKLDVPDLAEFNEWISAFKEQHEGARNAGKTIFMAAGADATVIGTNLQQIDFKAVQGGGETRIAAALRVHPSLVGLSEGLQGSALNAGNYQSVRRNFADGTMRPLWGEACGVLENLVDHPGGAHLWYDERDIAFLKEDLKERAEVAFLRAQTIRQYVDAGFKPDDVVAAVDADDISLLEHSGLFSVQLQAANAPKQGLFTGTPVPDKGDTPPSEEPGGAKPNGAVNGSGRELVLAGHREE